MVFGGHASEVGWFRSKTEHYFNDVAVLDRQGSVQWRAVSAEGALPAGREFHTLTAVSPTRLLLFGGDSSAPLAAAGVGSLMAIRKSECIVQAATGRPSSATPGGYCWRTTGIRQPSRARLRQTRRCRVTLATSLLWTQPACCGPTPGTQRRMPRLGCAGEDPDGWGPTDRPAGGFGLQRNERGIHVA